MAREIKPVTRDQVLYYNATAIAAAQTLPETADGGGGAAGNYVIYKAEGCVRVLGILECTTAPAAGFPRIRFWATPGDITLLTPIASYALTLDPLNANTYLLDTPLYSPFFSIEWTQGAAPGTFTGIAWVLAEAGASSGAGGVIPPPPPSPTSFPATYRLAFSGLVFSSAGGQFLELRNPAASGRVLRVSLQFFTKPSVTVHWQVQKQSALSTAGTATTPTPVSLDSSNPATVGVVKLYTVAPAAGASLGNVWDISTTGGDTFGDTPGGVTYFDEAIVLRAGESLGWMSDVAATMAGLIEFSDLAS